jgi:septal ring factor EnvC (AmiA/AmiB activator)
MSDTSTETTEMTTAQEEKYLVARLRRAAKQNEDVMTLLAVRADLAESNVALLQDVERLRAQRAEFTQQHAAQAAEVAASRAKQEAAITATLAGQRGEIERQAAVLEDQGKRIAANDARLAAQQAAITRLTKGAAALEPAGA